MAALDGFTESTSTFEGKARQVFRRGSGPAVLVLSEIPGITPSVADFARRVADLGCTAVLPSMFGTPGRAPSPGYLAQSVSHACVSKEFATWARNQTSPITSWLKALAREEHERCGGPGVGVVGMCLTGGFALAMMVDPVVAAPVLSQPSLPAGKKVKAQAEIGLSPGEISCVKGRMADEDLSVIGLRFKSDELVPDARFETYRREFGDRFEAIELEDEDAQPSFIPPHSVLTLHLKEDGPTKAAEARVIQFFRERTGA